MRRFFKAHFGSLLAWHRSARVLAVCCFIVNHPLLAIPGGLLILWMTQRWDAEQITEWEEEQRQKAAQAAHEKRLEQQKIDEERSRDIGRLPW